MAELSAPLVEMRDISKSFFGVKVLHEVNFDLFPGEVHVLLGENGAGKSTLMKILSAAYSRDSGEIFVGGRAVDFGHPADAREAGISTIYQHFSQAIHLTVAENLFLGNLPRTRVGLINWKRMTEDARAVLARVGADINPQTPVQKLGVAERQLVEIAAALSRQARILIMDEPTAALTEREVERLFTLIRSLTSQGAGVIYISHRLEELRSIGDRVTVLRDGYHVSTLPTRDADVNTLVRLMIGRDLQHIDVGRPDANAPEALRVENLSLRKQFEDISFRVLQGEIVGLTGLVGAGRTEVAKAIFGARPADTGTLYVHGKRVVIHKPSDALRLGIGFLTEDRTSNGLCMPLTIRENMTLPFWASGRHFLYGFLLNMRVERQLARQYAHDLDVRARNLGTPVKYLSGGNQQKVVLAKWLITQSKILIVDEPTAGIDIGSKEEVHKLIINFARQGGAVLLISSELPEVLKLSDRILVMARGRIAGELNRADASEERIMSYALQVTQG